LEPSETARRQQADSHAASRVLGTAQVKLAARGFSTFAAVASTPGGRIVSSVGVGRTPDGRPDRVGAFAAIVAAVMANPTRIREALDARKAERAAAAATESGAMGIVSAVDAAALPGLLVRVRSAGA
jgi:hypothetical protein